jgi:hypothetical protein
MYLRIVKRRNKDGSEVSYVQLAHNVWDAEKRQSRTRVIHNFGREDQLDHEALRRLVRSISRLLDPEQALSAQAPGDELPAVGADGRGVGARSSLAQARGRCGDRAGGRPPAGDAAGRAAVVRAGGQPRA